MTFVPSYRVQDLTFSDETSVTMSDDITSDILAVMGDKFSLQLIYTGSPAGTFKLEYSLDKTNWSEGAGTETVIDCPSNTLYILTNVVVPFVRVQFTRASGTGTLTAKVCAKSDL